MPKTCGAKVRRHCTTLFLLLQAALVGSGPGLGALTSQEAPQPFRVRGGPGSAGARDQEGRAAPALGPQGAPGLTPAASPRGRADSVSALSSQLTPVTGEGSDQLPRKGFPPPLVRDYEEPEFNLSVCHRHRQAWRSLKGNGLSSWDRTQCHAVTRFRQEKPEGALGLEGSRGLALH